MVVPRRHPFTFVVESGLTFPPSFYAHMLISWLFYGFILFTIYHELIFFTNMRQAYMLSPIYSTCIAARTLLVQTTPTPCLNESALRRIFDHVKPVWIPTDTSSLDDLVV